MCSSVQITLVERAWFVATDARCKSAKLGAFLLTGHLGGEIATHVRHEDGWFPIVFCVVFGALLWSGLLQRDGRLRAVLPWNR
jgi:hypothetical protein